MLQEIRPRRKRGHPPVLHGASLLLRLANMQHALALEFAVRLLIELGAFSSAATRG